MLWKSHIIEMYESLESTYEETFFGKVTIFYILHLQCQKRK